MPTISEMIATVNAYYEFRGLTDPTLVEAAKFLATEVGDLVNASTRLEDKWLRNNPMDASESRVQFEYELADCWMMLLKVIEKSPYKLDNLTATVEHDRWLVWSCRGESSASHLLTNTTDQGMDRLLTTAFLSAAYIYRRDGEDSHWYGEFINALLNIAKLIDTDPYTAMLRKFRSKGFVPTDSDNARTRNTVHTD